MTSNQNCFILIILSFYFLLISQTNAQEKIQAEKINLEVSNALLHPAIKNKEKESTEIPIIIPTAQPSNLAWSFRAWATEHTLKESLELLHIGISYQINAFIISGHEYQKGDGAQRKNFLKTCKEFNIRPILASELFSLPLKKSDLDEVNDFSNMEDVDIYIRIKEDLNLNADQTKEYISKIISQVKNKEKNIYLESFGKDDSLLSTLSAINDSRIILCPNWVKKNESMTAPLNPLINKYEGAKVIKADLSGKNLGENELLVLLQDYFGFRQTQCNEANKNISGFVLHFGSNITAFGTMNAVNIYTMGEFLLNRNKDIDLINHNYFTAMYGAKDGVELLNITSSSFMIIKQALYAGNSEISFTNNLLPEEPSAILTNGSLESWCKLKRHKSFRSVELFKEKLRAKELIEVLEKNYKTFIANKKIFDADATLAQINKTKDIVDLLQDYTSIFLQAQFEPVTAEHLKTIQAHSKKYPKLENIVNDFKNIYIDQNHDALDNIPLENLPAYLKKKSDRKE